ncbi:PilW family protein [Methylolobus aquaticus]
MTHRLTQSGGHVAPRPGLDWGRMGGFSLVEVMIGLTAGLILIAGIGQIYLGSRQTYRLQEGQARLQEDGRFVIEFLKKNIRIAGYRSIPWNTGPVAFPARATVPSFSTGQVITGTADSVSIRLQGAGDGKGDADDRVADCLGAALDRCDVAINTFAADIDDAELECSVIVVTMTQEQNEATPQLNECSATAGVTARTITLKSPQPLVSGFGNLNVLYGLYTGGTLPTIRYLPAISVPAGSWGNVVSVRIGFELRSEDNLIAAPQTYVFNGVEVTDRRLRRSFETTIALRNKLP